MIGVITVTKPPQPLPGMSVFCVLSFAMLEHCFEFFFKRSRRTFPLSATFRYSVGLPDKITNVPVMTTARNGSPLIVWQSVQLQIVVLSGSASASNVTWPQ
jgi:hypothetical protein